MSHQIARSSGTNIARRVLAAVGATGGRHLLAILSGIVIARSLGPVDYGYLAFLLAGFTTLHTLLDLSSSQAFYTLVCRSPWPLSKLRLYGCWIALQLALPLTIIWLVMPTTWVSEIWHGQARSVVVMALLSSFSQRVLWQTVMQIYESYRLTIRVQFVTVAIMLVHLIVVVVLERMQLLSITTVLLAVCAEFLLASIFMLTQLSRPAAADVSQESNRETFGKMATFMWPLMLPLVLQAGSGFVETWLLQMYGGPREQGFFNIAQQYANIGLVFGFSATNVFWKEMAVADARGDREDMKRVYVNSSRILFFLAAVIAGFGCFWASPIIVFLLGSEYAPAGPAFSLTLLSSVFQCFGIIMTVTFLATSRTRLWSLFTVLYAVANLALTTLLVALIQLGAAGMALKFVLLNATFVLVYDWYICRSYGWRMDNGFRALVAVVIFVVGAANYQGVHLLMSGQPAVLMLVVGGLVYGLTVGVAGFFIARRFGLWDRFAKLFVPANG